MAQFSFRGFMAAVFTPFKNNCSKDLNLEIIPQYASFLNRSGVRGVLVNGSTGEGMSMATDERKASSEAWLGLKNKENLTVMIQIGGAALPEVLRMAEHAENNKADAILCLPELYIRPNSPQELIRYLQNVSKAAPKTPLFYYHIPKNTGVQINMVKFLEEATGKIPNFCGLKFTSNDLDEGSACLKVNGGKYVVFLGAVPVLIGANALGFNSSIATTVNMLADRSANLFKPFESEENFRQRQKEQNDLNEIVSTITKHGLWLPTMKAAMPLITGIDVGPVREPVQQLSDSQIAALRNDLKKFNFPHKV